MSSQPIKVGSDFSGVGAFNQALLRLGIKYDELFACDMDKYARQTFILNYGEPKYFPKDVYEREIPNESLDIYMTSPPCQAFSISGKRLGKKDQRGILFFNSLGFIQENKPRYFVFENVKGLLSHDKVDKTAEYGRTFQEWINYLGGKSINGVHTFFPYEDSVPYHIYFQVLNAKHYGIPQNRERIFIIGIRDDADNDFQFPKPFPLEKRLRDILEKEVDEKYFLSEKAIEGLFNHAERHKEKGNGFGANISDENDISNTIKSRYYKDGSDQLIRILDENIVIQKTRSDCTTFRNDGIIGTLQAGDQSGSDKIPVILIKTNNSKGFDEAEEEEDSINFSVPSSTTRRGRVGKKVAQTLDTQCNQGIYTKERIRRLTPLECFRLMDFNFGLEGVKNFIWDVSDTQAYKQAGNSICVGVLAELIKKLKL